MTKSLTSALIGVRVGQGAASLDDAGSAVAPEWPSPDDATNGADTRSSITVRSLLQMSSGLAFAEVCGGVQSETSVGAVAPCACAWSCYAISTR